MIEDIPDEILLIIFSKLDLRSITRAGGTCRRWRNLSKDGKTIQYIAKHAFDYQEWIQHDFLPKADNIYLAKILGIFSLNGMNEELISIQKSLNVYFGVRTTSK